jgi:cobalt transporter subunit CbtA
MGVIQHLRVTPLIIAAEAYEVPAVGEATGHSHDTGWMPADGWPRTLSTTLTAMLAGAGWAAALAGVSLLSGVAITRRTGLIWGLSGFLAASLAPAAGLPPDMPGMPEGDLAAKQLWWSGTIAATAIGLWLIAFLPRLWAKALAVVLIALPQVIGAPQPASLATAVPAPLAASYVATALAANAVFWALIGLLLGLALDRFAKEMFPA